MQPNIIKCAFTGHRKLYQEFSYSHASEKVSELKQVLRSEIIRMIKHNGVNYFISGMAYGVDMYAAEIVLDLKEIYPHIQLECAIPCRDQTARWSPASRKQYLNITKQSDKIELLQLEYTPDCMQKRNRYMVDNADYLIAVWNGSSSGTGSTVNYAMQQNRKIAIINPNSLNVRYTY